MLSTFAGTNIQLFEDNDYARSGMMGLIDHHVLLIAETIDFSRGLIDFKKRVGFIGGYFVAHPFNPKVKMLSELFWWVDEDERGHSAGARLLREFVAFGKRNADWIVFGLNDKTPIKERSILKMGFKSHERCYLMETR